MSFAATWMGLEITILSKPETKTGIIGYHLYVETYFSKIQMYLISKEKQIHRHRKHTYDYQKGKRAGAINQKFGININTLLYLKQITKQDLLDSSGNYDQYFLIRIICVCVCTLSSLVVSNSCNPMDCSPPGSCPWDFPGKNTGVGCHFHFQGIFLTQGSNLCLVTYSQSNINRTHVYDTGNADCDGCQTDLILRYICHLRKW